MKHVETYSHFIKDSNCKPIMPYMCETGELLRLEEA